MLTTLQPYLAGAGVIVLAWLVLRGAWSLLGLVRDRRRAGSQRLQDQVDDLDGRVAAIEGWRAMNADGVSVTATGGTIGSRATRLVDAPAADQPVIEPPPLPRPPQSEQG